MHNTKSSKSSKSSKTEQYVGELQRRDEQKMIANHHRDRYMTNKNPSNYFHNFQPVYTNRLPEPPCGTSLLDHIR